MPCAAQAFSVEVQAKLQANINSQLALAPTAAYGGLGESLSPVSVVTAVTCLGTGVHVSVIRQKPLCGLQCKVSCLSVLYQPCSV